ncbi:TetR/AcrR family transcriptional regulator [Actinomadura flavalba]|uniref:TetR/AcrR family transcriptional regulator n=1 Tax=Actinomadura flavalba TaxID=1120938 RepID=UPI0003706CEC|nr:TetR/AcrR family transcriptional regulator [Actinomadura flavalba]
MDARSGRDRILRAALTCFARDGAATTTLTALRAEAGVSVGSFYHHFQSKEEVVAALFTDALAGYHRAFLAELRRHPAPGDAVAAGVALHVRWCLDHPQEARFLLMERPPQRDEPGAEALAAQNRDFFTEIRAWWRIHEHHGALRPLDLPTAAALWLGPAQELCRSWATGRLPEPTTAQLDVLADAARRALCR